MILRDDLLTPIEGANHSGLNPRYSPEYNQIKEGREPGDDLPQGEWTTGRKIVNYPDIISLSQSVLATQGKHLQIAAWLTEALLNYEGFSGLRSGLDISFGLLDKFWDTIYPLLGEDGDYGGRAEPLRWIGSKLIIPLNKVYLTSDGVDWYRFKKSREKSLKEGKSSSEEFDKSLAATPKVLYSSAEKDIDGCLLSLSRLNSLCCDKFAPPPQVRGRPNKEDYTPSFQPLKDALEEIRRDVHGLLDKKRATEPDLVEPRPNEKVETLPQTGPLTPTEPNSQIVSTRRLTFSSLPIAEPFAPDFEPLDQGGAVAAIMAAASQLRAENPYSPAAYLMLRGLRWGELRAALAASDQTMMEAPPREIRQQAKRLALDRKWKDLLEFCENAMSLPYSRAWLDLQRFAVEACAALGDEYNAITLAIRSELRALLRDYPDLLDARLMDDTAVANLETQTWLHGLLGEPEKGRSNIKAFGNASNGDAPGWQRTFIDSSALASDALRTGQEQKAFEILFNELDRQRSGRGRFQRKLQLIQLCVAAGKDAIAQPFLEDIMTSIDNHKLEDWEDRELIAGALGTVMQFSKRIQADAKEKQKLFERICRLDPVRALSS